MKVGASPSFIELRAPSGLFAKTGRSLASGTEAEVSESPLAKLMNDWHEAQANALAGVKSNAQQAALDKAAILKQRLEALKAMLLFASPEMAKSIAQQLKGIASELASLGKSVGGSVSGSATLAAPTAAPSAGEATSAAATDDASVDVAAEQTTIDQSSASASQTDDGSDVVGEKSGNKSGNEGGKAGESTQKSEDNALRNAIEDAKRLLKALIQGVKAKLREGDEVARRDLQAAEKRLADLESKPAQHASAGLYTALGGLSLASAGADLSLSSTTASVDVNV